MTIQEVFKLYKLESWNFVDIPDRGIPFLAKYEIDKNEIESSLLNSFEFIDLILEDNEDKFFIFQILACTTNFPKKYLNNILELILMIENNHSQVLFHLQRNFGFLIIEDWFQEKFNLSYSEIYKINILKAWSMHYLYDFFSNATVEGYRVIESKSAFSFSENMYVFDNDYINEFLKLKENCTSVLEFEKDLNFKLQKRLEIIFNYLINNNWSLKFLMSIDDFIIRQVGINESNLLLLEKVNKQVLSFATKEKGNLDFWFSNRKSLLN